MDILSLFKVVMIALHFAAYSKAMFDCSLLKCEDCVGHKECVFVVGDKDFCTHKSVTLINNNEFILDSSKCQLFSRGEVETQDSFGISQDGNDSAMEKEDSVFDFNTIVPTPTNYKSVITSGAGEIHANEYKHSSSSRQAKLPTIKLDGNGEVDLEEGDTSLVTEVVASEDEHRNGTEFGQFPTAATNFYPKSGTDESTLLADVSVNFKGGIRSGQIAPPEIHSTKITTPATKSVINGSRSLLEEFKPPKAGGRIDTADGFQMVYYNFDWKEWSLLVIGMAIIFFMVACVCFCCGRFCCKKPEIIEYNLNCEAGKFTSKRDATVGTQQQAKQAVKIESGPGPESQKSFVIDEIKEPPINIQMRKPRLENRTTVPRHAGSFRPEAAKAQGICQTQKVFDKKEIKDGDLVEAALNSTGVKAQPVNIQMRTLGLENQPAEHIYTEIGKGKGRKMESAV